MIRDFNDFITHKISSNDRITFKLNNYNICKLYYDLGYRKSKLDNKMVYFILEDNDLTPISLSYLKPVFFEMLKNKDFSNIPEELDYDSILNWYLMSSQISINDNFKSFLEVKMTEQEEHTYRLKTNSKYKKEFEYREFIKKMDELGFSQTIDKSITYGVDNPLYYKHISNEEYIVFNYFIYKGKAIHEFDYNISTFKCAEHIGKVKPIENSLIIKAFNFKRDYHLIKHLIEKEEEIRIVEGV